MSVFSRLWLGGALSWQRDTALIEPMIEQVRAAAQPRQPILFAVDGFKAYVKSPRQVEVLDETTDNRLTITTCHPRYSLSQRLVLIADLKGEAAAPSPASKRVEVKPAEEDLSGDPSARGPAILWGLAAGAVWLAAYLVGRRWRKWPAYLIGAPVFFVLLFVFFENFARLLPANY
jgi:sortase A